jgi:hypothetical protein
MLSILVVGETSAGSAPSGPDSALEVLNARDADEAVEKLGRNRRIDAVLILSFDAEAATVAAIREDVLAPPPIFLGEGAGEIPGARRLPARQPARLLELIVETLGG